MAGSDKKLQGFTSFNAGEYSSDLAGRTDLESFGSSTRYTCNMLTQVSGGLKKFYGTRHITEKSVDNYNIKMIPFINKYEPMAFVVYGSENDEDTGLKVGLIHGNEYKELEIELPVTVNPQELRWQQVNDRLILCHKSVQPFSIDFYGQDEQGEYIFNTNNLDFKEVPYFPVGSTDDYSGELQASGLSGEITLTIPTGSSNIKTYMPPVLMAQSTYTRYYKYHNAGAYEYPVVNSSTFRLYRDRAGTVTQLAAGIVNSAITTKKQPSGQTLYTYTAQDSINRERALNIVKTVCPEAYISGSMIVMPTLTGHQSGDKYYTVLEIGRGYKHTHSTNFWDPSVSQSSEYEPEEITTDTIDAEALIGRKMKFFFDEDTVVSPWWQGKTVNTGEYAYSNGHWYKATNGGTCGNVQPSHTYGVRSDGGVAWLYVHSGSNTATVMSVPDDHTIKIFVEKGELPNVANNIYKVYSWSIWGKDDVHPSEVYMAGERLGFVCNTKSFGSWNSMSITGDYFNFDTEEYGEQLDTSAIVHLVANNEASDINWVLARSRIYMGGYSGEYYINPGGNGRRAAVYTPTSTITENISNLGGKSVIPLKYKELNMFVGITGKELYTIAYDYTTDDYTPKSMGYLTQHIMERGIRRLQALNNLDRNIYLLHDTNQMSLFNYAAEQKVIGFTELDFGCEIVDFVTTYSNDDVTGYVMTKRNDDKVTIERLAVHEPTYMFDEITQGDGTLADFQPVAHFANKEVYIKYGEGMTQFVKVTLDENGDVSHNIEDGVYMPQSEYFKVGLPMVAEVHTQPAFGTKLEGHQQQSLSVYLRLNKSGSFDYGSSVDFNQYFHYNVWNLMQDYGDGHRLYTGDLLLNIPLGYAEMQNQGEGKYPNTSGVGINIKSDTPEPLNLLSMQEIYI